MKPVAIFRHTPTVGPGHFAEFLDQHDIPWQLFRVDAGDTIPAEPGLFSGICFLGGSMSVNDPLPWIEPALALIRNAVAQDVPLIGHCLGGQLMSKALGGNVSVNPVEEIGWHRLRLSDSAAAQAWFGDCDTEVPVFQWHGDTFSIPPQAIRIASGDHCENQMFVMGKHLGMQCHIEMTHDLVESWCNSMSARRSGPATQSSVQMLNNLEQHVAALNCFADRLYRRWIGGLRRDDSAEALTHL